MALLRAVPEDDHNFASLLMLGETLWELGEWKEAESIFQEADSRATTEEQKLSLTRARTWNLFLGSGQVTQALTVNSEARNQIISLDGHKILDINEGCIKSVTGNPQAALPLLRHLEEEVGDSRDVSMWAQGAIMKTNCLAILGRSMEAISWAEHAYSSHLGVDEHALSPHPSSQLVPLIFAYAEIGDLTSARDIGQRAFHEVSDTYTSVPRLWAAFNLGRTEWLAGRIMQARSWFAECAALARARGHEHVLSLVLGYLAACASVLGDEAGAQQALLTSRKYPRINRLVGEEDLGRAWLCAAMGDLPSARGILLRSAERARASGHVSSELLLLTDAVRLGGANAAIDRMREIGPSCEGALASVRVSLAEALLLDEPEALADVAENFSEMGYFLLAAEAATTGAAALIRAGKTRRSSALGQLAAMSAAQCPGARTPLLGIIGDVAILTSREREVALLAARGTPSKEIAAIMVLSVRTVDNHLQNIYSKLGISSRRELSDVLER
ncbi:LuxR C-terminal-related transcriptional regulator [Streptomyces sp. NPDC059688]|uniref:LuxR C-terminal-related transcriptional regulator n=1 Tax=Streptomyces sp. NPDC059688 TaxID=3346906 RepID=UPI0036CABD9D